MAGTLVPDWLSVVDRKMRARKRLVEPVVDATDDDDIRQLGKGILQHHHDDDVFHRCEKFMQLEGQIGKEFRQYMPDRFDHRPGFLGHIVVELMLDAVIAANDSDILDQFYATVGLVNAEFVQSAVNAMATRQTDKLAPLIVRFREEKFLYDYVDDSGMFLRLNQVLARVKLPPMSEECKQVLPFARELMHVHGQELLSIVEGTDSGLA